MMKRKYGWKDLPQLQMQIEKTLKRGKKKVKLKILNQQLTKLK